MAFQTLASGSQLGSTFDLCQVSREGCEDLGMTSEEQKMASLGSKGECPDHAGH